MVLGTHVPKPGTPRKPGNTQVKLTEQRCMETRNPNLLDVLLFCTGAHPLLI